MLHNEVGAYFQDVLPFWKKLSEAEKSILMKNTYLKSVDRGQIIHQSGDCTGLLIVKKGQIRSFILSEGGKEITLFRLLERDVCILSSSCAMHSITFDIQVEAEKDSQIYFVPTDSYKSISQANGTVKDFVVEMMATRLSEVMWVIEQVVFMSFDKRLAHFLLEQLAIEGSENLKLTHEGIAKNLGSAREVVTRMLKYFHSEGIVSLSRGVVKIKDKKRILELMG